MELRNLKTFVTIVRLGGFTKAAAVLGYAQSTVTAQVKALEEELGTVLFERFGRGVSLTRDGENLLAYAEQIVKLADAAKASAPGEGMRGTLAIATPESYCLHRLPELLKEYRELYPEVELKLHFGCCCDCHEMLQKNLVDASFFLDKPICEADLVSLPLSEEPVVLLASPRHPLTSNASVGPADLDGQSFILTESGCNLRARFEKVLAEHGVRPFPAMELSNVEIIKRFTRDNLGLTILSRMTAEDDLAAGRLAALPWRGPSFDVQAQLVHHRDKWLSPALKAFIELTVKRLRALPPDAKK